MAELAFMPRGRKFFDLPLEIQAMIMEYLPWGSLRHLLAASHRARDTFKVYFHTFFLSVAQRHPKTPFNNELKHILYRVLILHSSPQKPFHGTPLAWIEWHSAFRHRSEATLPPEPPVDVDTLEYLDDVLGAVDWMEKGLQALFNNVAVRGTIAAYAAPEERLSASESYRMRRALLLFQLFCELFHQSSQDREYCFHGRVAEQTTFFQGLHAHLVGELDSIYGMIEDLVHAVFGLCCQGRVSYAFLPGAPFGTLGSPALEHLYSRGLVFLQEHIGKGLSDDKPANCHFAPPEVANRFFNTALANAWTFRHSRRQHYRADEPAIPNFGVDQLSPLTPRAEVIWEGAPPGTSAGTHAWYAFHAYHAPMTRPSSPDPNQLSIKAYLTSVRRHLTPLRFQAFLTRLSWVLSANDDPPPPLTRLEALAPPGLASPHDVALLALCDKENAAGLPFWDPARVVRNAARIDSRGDVLAGEGLVRHVRWERVAQQEAHDVAAAALPPETRYVPRRRPGRSPGRRDGAAWLRPWNLARGWVELPAAEGAGEKGGVEGEEEGEEEGGAGRVSQATLFRPPPSYEMA